MYRGLRRPGACRVFRKGKRQIAVIPKATSHMFWLTVQKGAFDAGPRIQRRDSLEWSRQPKRISAGRSRLSIPWLRSAWMASLIAAAERKALVTSVERATAANIPVTVFDSGLDSTQYISYVATDNVEAGRACGAHADRTPRREGQDRCSHACAGQRLDYGSGERIYGGHGGRGPDIQIVATQYGMSDRSKARAAAENILTAHPDLNGMFASSEPSSIGASLAIQGRELKDKVILVAFDASDTMVEDLRSGAIDAMIVQDAHRMGYEAVKTIVDKLNGKTPPRRLDLRAVRVTAKDLGEPEVKRLLNLQ